MSTGTRKKKRMDRVTSVALPPGLWSNLAAKLRRGSVLLRLALCLVTAIVLWALTQGWAPPQAFRKSTIPLRNITARIQFEQVDEQATREAREQARRLAVAVYDQDPQPIIQLRAQLLNDVSRLRAAKDLASVSDLWQQFQLEPADGSAAISEEALQKQFEEFRTAIAEEDAFGRFKLAVEEAIKPLEESGLLEVVPEEHDANMQRIAVRPVGTTEGFEKQVPMSDVRITDAAGNLRKSLDQRLDKLALALPVFAYLQPQLPATLKFNLEATRAVQDRTEAEVKDQTIVYEPGDQLAVAGTPLSDNALELLNLEYQAELASRSWADKVSYSLALLGMYIALYTLCGFYILYRWPIIIQELPRLLTLLALVVVVVGAMLVCPQEWRAEVAPLLLFGMTIAVAYQQELALLLSTAVTLVGVLALGYGLGEALVLLATVAGAILVLKQVRSRSKLLLVGFIAAVVALLTTIGVGTLEGLPWLPLAKQGLSYALWSVIAGSLMTCLLPGVERLFGVQTDLSLIELGDPAHPLLQELIRRAPGTYNHSITVASIAEAAAESIGARGLLVRVGAYFHDIGKMLKPGYFIENQGQGDSRHDSLVPAMSTLVIIAHVKDGADLARQNKLPQPMIDFIQQHHGTTLVEYFYRQANQQNKENDGDKVDESTFRYPGPKPQTKEAGVLMLADAVESASRALVEPTPARIESLVDDMCRKRLLDGQFDECGLTLEEVRTIGDSLVKSLTAVYHGRVKYPDQETA